jgi:bifunctional pyridoxal-dependent enzyme with beta-cystathionase and maltose regulon repressor activities
MTKIENKRERFRRLATLRTNIVLQRLKVLGNCANRQAYEYTEEEVKKIFSTIEEQMKIIRTKFHFPKEKEFKL